MRLFDSLVLSPDDNLWNIADVIVFRNPDKVNQFDTGKDMLNNNKYELILNYPKLSHTNIYLSQF